MIRYYEKVRDVRQNKGSILRASVEYIRLLKEDLATKLQLDKLCRLQQYQNRKLLHQIQARHRLQGACTVFSCQEHAHCAV